MTAREIQDQNGVAREMLVQQAINGNAEVRTSALQRNTASNAEDEGDYVLVSAAGNRFREPNESMVSVTRIDVTKLIGVLRQLEVIAKRQTSRVAFRAKGRIVLMDLAEIVSVQAQGNYVSLLRQPNSYLLRESLSSVAEKLKPYGFVRIQRSVVVNTLVVEEIHPLATGKYSLRVKGGKEYMVTRKYKDSVRDLAQLWLGSEHLPG